MVTPGATLKVVNLTISVGEDGTVSGSASLQVSLKQTACRLTRQPRMRGRRTFNTAHGPFTLQRRGENPSSILRSSEPSNGGSLPSAYTMLRPWLG